MRDWAFFSPSLHPVLDGGKGYEHAVVAPQVPTRWAVGQTVFDHEPHRQIDHPMGILTARWGQIREVGAKVLTTLRTVMLGRGHKQITRTPHVEIPQVVQRPMRLLVPIGRVTTARTRVSDVVATIRDDLGLGQVCGCGDPGAGVGSVLTWTEHRVALLAQRFGPELYDKRLREATRCSRYSLVKYPHFSTYTREFCHGLPSLFLPLGAGRPGVAVPHAPVGVAQRLRHRVPNDTRPHPPTAKAPPRAHTVCGIHPEAALRRLCARPRPPPARSLSTATAPRAHAGAPPPGRDLDALLPPPSLCLSRLGGLGESPRQWASQWGSLAATAVCGLSWLFSGDPRHPLAWQ